MPEEVHFIAVNYRSAGVVPAFVESLLAQDCSAWSATIVDNSVDPAELRTLRGITAASDRITVRDGVRNHGYFGAAHRVVAEAAAWPYLWTVVSNVDICLTDVEFVRRLLADRSGAAVLAPDIVGMPGGAPLNPFLTHRPSAAWMWRRRAIFANPVLAQVYALAAWGMGRLRPRSDATRGRGRSAYPIYAPHGSIIAFHRRYFEAGGSLEHPVFLFNEEITVAERCRELRLTVRHDPSLRVVHTMHRSTGVLRSPRLLRAQADAAAYGYRLVAGKLPPAAHR